MFPDLAPHVVIGNPEVELIWHPHIHCLVTDGVFDLAGNFHPVSGIDSDQATILFREKVFAMMPVCVPHRQKGKQSHQRRPGGKYEKLAPFWLFGS
ncbi:MAG: transposase [Acidobacteria bacterium]|nr:transposase [Acidobacteriota bacterium]MBU4306306.1 transposase [Acidobacteriota bacterium]MBU4404587.1 transposase [Acidobacteriota bacterium]